MKPQLAILLLLIGCQSGGGNSDVTQNILHCESYGDVTETISTITNEAPDELETGTGDTTEVGQSDIQQREPTGTVDLTAGIQPAVPGLGIGVVKSYVAATDEQLQQCESEATCAVLGFRGSKALVEHCVGITFPEVER